jgi:hypothetical protein
MHWDLFFQLVWPFFVFCLVATVWDWIGNKIFR